MSKKSVAVILTVVFVLMLALAGCGGKKSEAPVTAKDDKSGAVTRGGVLKTAQAAKWSSLDPTVSSGRANDKFIMNQLYETLIDVDSSGKYIPGLAESWEVKEGKTIVLKLKKNVKFHDGTEFNAAAVKFLLERA